MRCGIRSIHRSAKNDMPFKYFGDGNTQVSRISESNEVGIVLFCTRMAFGHPVNERNFVFSCKTRSYNPRCEHQLTNYSSGNHARRPCQDPILYIRITTEEVGSGEIVDWWYNGKRFVGSKLDVNGRACEINHWMTEQPSFKHVGDCCKLG